MKNFLFIAVAMMATMFVSCADEASVNDQITDSVTTAVDTTAVADTAAVDTAVSVVIP